MNLDNKGWSLQMMLVFCFILILALLISGFHIQGIINNNNNIKKPINPNINNNTNNTNNTVTPTYQTIETKMITAAKEYQTTFYSDLPENDSYVVTLSTLINLDYTETIYDINKSNIKCSGYIIFKKVDDVVTYTPYLKCGDEYEKEGYLKRLDSN